MKSFLYLLLASATFFLYSCKTTTNEPTEIGNSTVQFGFGTGNSLAKNSLSKVQTGDISSIIVDITDNLGNLVLTSKTLKV